MAWIHLIRNKVHSLNSFFLATITSSSFPVVTFSFSFFLFLYLSSKSSFVLVTKMYFSRSRNDIMTPSSSSTNSSRSLLFIPLIVGLMLQMAVPAATAPVPSAVAAVTTNVTATTNQTSLPSLNFQRGSTSNAAQRAAQMSKENATSEANQFKVSNQTVPETELTPWYEKHENARPRPAMELIKNATVITQGRVLSNATVVPANGTIIAHNGTVIANGTEIFSSTSSNSTSVNQTSLPSTNQTSSSNQAVKAFQGLKEIDHTTKVEKLKARKEHNHEKDKNKHKKKKSKHSTDKKKKKHHSSSSSSNGKQKAFIADSSSDAEDCSTVSTNTAAFPTHPPLLTPSSTNNPPTTTSTNPPTTSPTNSPNNTGSCFPALGFQMPSKVPSSLNGWWCDPTDEYAFLGFSYEISACQSQSQLIREFKDARNTFNARYVRLYGACDQADYYGKVVEAAWQAGIGVHALIWFGFTGGDQWKVRRDSLLTQLHTNPKAKFVTRAVQFGSEPLFDWVMSGTSLAKQVIRAKSKLADLKINVTVSDMAYAYQMQQNSGSQNVLNAIDFIDAHMLPYFAQDASTGGNAWHDNANDMNYFLSKAPNKKIYWSENGWPSTHDCSAGVCPNSKAAVSNVANEKAYYDLLDQKCPTMKQYPQGGVGWFAHIYSDNQEPGYGIYDTKGKLKFAFKPRTSC